MAGLRDRYQTGDEFRHDQDTPHRSLRQGTSTLGRVDIDTLARKGQVLSLSQIPPVSGTCDLVPMVLPP